MPDPTQNLEAQAEPEVPDMFTVPPEVAVAAVQAELQQQLDYANQFNATMAEAAIAGLKEQQETWKALSQADSYASKGLQGAGLVVGGAATAAGPGAVAFVITGGILYIGGVGFDIASSYNANQASAIGDRIADLQKIADQGKR